MTPILHSPSSGLPYAVGPVETPEIDLQIRTLFDKMGLKWCYGGSYLTQTYWNAYKHLAAYCPTKGEYSYLDFYKGHPDRYTLISATDFMALNTESKPKRGDWVMVGDSEPPTKKRIFLAEVEGAELPYVCVDSADVAKFQKREKVRAVSWKFMAPIVEPERAEPTNNRRALLENPELLPLIKDLYSYRKQNPQFDPLPCAKRFIASELSILDPKN